MELIKPSRRGFLLGLGATIAAPAIVRAASLMPVRAFDDLMVYGRSPAAVVLPDLAFLEGMSQKMIATIIYGNSEMAPRQFAAFRTPFFSN